MHCSPILRVAALRSKHRVIGDADHEGAAGFATNMAKRPVILNISFVRAWHVAIGTKHKLAMI